ncbi:unnamed protein product [Pedinophyceae sp. YPF-701]|nr:unnamed protein product [Pedinophyceae sp. YPF-701]
MDAEKMLQPPENGVPPLTTFQAPRYIEKVNKLLGQLAQDPSSPRPPWDAESLPGLLHSLVRFMDRHLGAKAPQEDRVIPKIAWSNFLDTSEGGSVMLMAPILAKALSPPPNGEGLDLDMPQNKERGLNLVKEIRQLLIERRRIRAQAIGFEARVPAKTKRELEDKIQYLGAVVVPAGSKGCSHLLCPEPDNAIPPTGVATRETPGDGEARIHHKGLPDSYDRWVPEDVAPQRENTSSTGRLPLKIRVSWVTQSFYYNEWLNPLDFLVADMVVPEPAEPPRAADAAKDAPGATAGQAKDAAAPGAVAKEAPVQQPTQELQDLVGEALAEVGYADRPTRTRHDAPSVPEAALVVSLSQGQQRGVPEGILHPVLAAGLATEVPAAKRRRTDAQPAPDAAGRPLLPSGAQHPLGEVRVRGGGVFMVPAFASWYRRGEVSEIERQGLPEFFSGLSASKDEQTYIQHRDTMISRYIEGLRAGRPLISFADAKAGLEGDDGGKLRVFRFLERWSLINTPPASPSGAAPVGCSTAVPPVPEPRGYPQSLSTNGLDAILRPTGLSSTQVVAALTSAAGDHAAAASGLTTVLAGPDIEPFLRAPGYVAPERRCAATGAKCGTVRYRSTKYADCDLTPGAYETGLFPTGTSSADFVRVERRAGREVEDGEDADGETAEWSHTEILQLLEGVEKFGDDWGRVAAHVGTKNMFECVHKFLRLPIEELVTHEALHLVTVETAAARRAAVATGEDGAAAAEPHVSAAAEAAARDPLSALPFASAPNPVMAMVNFLALLIGPKIAAAAAARALAVLAEEAEGAEASGDAGAVANGGNAAGGGAAGAAPRIPPKAEVRAMAAGLAAAAARAKMMADSEEIEMRRLTMHAAEGVCKRAELKAKILEDLDGLVAAEVDALAQKRRELLKERAAVQAQSKQGQGGRQAGARQT